MIDKKYIDLALPTFKWEVENGRLRAFARAIGEKRPEYVDEDAARAAGYPSLLAPPTIAFSAEMDTGTLQRLLGTLGVDMANVLHGEQSFAYHRPIFAGDVLSIDVRVTGIVDKKGGAMEFVTKETKVTNRNGEPVCEMHSVIVVRNK